MGKIVILDESTSNKIAAGEVIERPASVVKELVENAIDAGADSISVEIKNGGISYIKVTDNGAGIEEDDVEIAFERHATSKIRNSGDLESITTLGFRGEALASIAAVSSVEVVSRVSKKPYGTFLKIEGGRVKESGQKGCPAGTVFTVKDLFFNTPARFKFLKKDSTEAGYVADLITRMALGNPGISFKLVSNNSSVIHTPGNNDLLSTIFSLYGREVAGSTIKMDYKDNKFKITGYAGKAEIARSNRNHQSIFVNGRYVKSKLIASAIDEAYKTLLMKNKYAFIVMNIEVNPMLVDVNVHPTKMEIRFSDEQDVFRSIYHAVNNALLSRSQIKEASLDGPEKLNYRMNQNVFDRQNYAQQKLDTCGSFTVDKQERGDAADNLASGPLKKNNFLVMENNNGEEVVSGKNRGNEGPARESMGNISAEEKRGKEEEKAARKNAAAAADAFQDAKKDGAEYNRTQFQRDEPVKEKLTGYKIIGQAFSTYIFLQREGEILVIDQHAAHERITFEELKKKYSNKEHLSQFLLAPVVVELTSEEHGFVFNHKSFFESLGFIFESFGNNSIILRSVPVKSDTESVREVFLQVVDHIIGVEKSDFTENVEDILYTLACKAAIKANKKLDDIEIRNILKNLENIENPYTCPHGRPTIIKITRNELEKMFKRIV
ncbi:MAG: DNA mismatch repair endonuclease MutL [Clostridiales bacterium]|nr:DNA mismatch repair endonuclease MutL [Eubacteriales bacterium]MDH7565141.1 DNA mismatch repair endonuclease MutL [Clostridiales bacterium]